MHVHAGSAASESGTTPLKTAVLETADSWDEFRIWMHDSGVESLQSRYPGMASADSASPNVEARLIASGVPPAIARSLLDQHRADRDVHSVSRLQFSPGVTGISRIGEGNTSNVFASQVFDAEALKADLRHFLTNVAGIHNGKLSDIERQVSEIIDRISQSTNLWVTKVLKSTRFLRRTKAEIRTILLKGRELPNIPAVVGGKSAPDALLFHMQHIPGLDLQRVMDLWGTRSTPMRFNQDAAALSARSIATNDQAGVIHRDIKPANFLVADDGRFYTLDLGFARDEENESQQSIADGTVGVGTPMFIAPEQARRDPEVTSAADVFSLGVMLWRMYTGQFPYGAPNAAVAVVVAERLSMRAGHKVPEFDAAPESLAGVDPQRAKRFLRELKPMLESMIDPDPKARPTPDRVANFFRSHSSFGATSFDEFMKIETYHQHRLSLDPLVSALEEDVPVKHRYKTDGTMVDALVNGAQGRAKQYDFLANPAFDPVEDEDALASVSPEAGSPLVEAAAIPSSDTAALVAAIDTLPPETRVALVQALEHSKESGGPSKRIRVTIGAVVVVVVAGVVTLLLNNGGKTKEGDAKAVAVAPLDGKKEGSGLPDVGKAAAQHTEVATTVEVPKPPERAMEFKTGPGGPEELRLFRTDSIKFSAKDMMPLYSGNGKDQILVGAGFQCTPEHIARILKLSDVSQIPEGVRKNLESFQKNQGGILGYTLQLEDGTGGTWINTVGLFVENREGEMVFFSSVEEFAKAREAEFVRHGGLQAMTTDPASIHLLRNAKDITGTGVKPAHWSGELADDDMWKRTVNQLLSFRNRIDPDAVGQR